MGQVMTFIWIFNFNLQDPFEEGTLIILILQMIKLMFREVY